MSEYIMHYKAAAKNIGEAIPVGNGHIGGMIYGRPADEVIKINIESFWSGRKLYRMNPESKSGLSEARELLRNGDVRGAEKVAVEKMCPVIPESRRFMPFLGLHIKSLPMGKTSKYVRSLNTQTGVADVEFSAGEKNYKRTVFCTKDEGLVIGLFCDAEKSISFDAWIEGREEFCSEHFCTVDRIVYSGGIGGRSGINYTARLTAKVQDGEITFAGNRMSVRNATAVMIIFNAATDVNDSDYFTKADESAENALRLSYKEISERYISSYREIFDRVSLSIDDNTQENLEKFSTDERMRRIKGDELNNKECTRLIHDNKLIELYFNFSRYMMITGRNAVYPLNSCGMWNENPELSFRYELAGNLQMCYWSADMCDMAECLPPFFNYINLLCEEGREVAEKMYSSGGSVCHTSSDLWGDSVPHGKSTSSLWCMPLAWLALHVFEHYEYTLDVGFLRERYGIMKSAAEFFADYLTDDGNGFLVVSPSVSPTNSYISANGAKADLCLSSSVDSQILTVLFGDIVKAGEILGDDKEFTEKARAILQKLPEPEAGTYGQIKQWGEEYGESASENSILYQLFALHPADMITPSKTPKLADASRTTLVRRLIHGGLDKGWSCAWTANMWARLYDGHMVYENIKNLLTRSTYPNLVNMSPCFSIDTNMGAVSAIVESLLQSTGGEIVLLPALPDEWKSGSVSGLRAKGGFRISMEWKNGRLTGAEIVSEQGSDCRLRVANNAAVSIMYEDEGVGTKIENGVIIFSTKKNRVYTVKC